MLTYSQPVFSILFIISYIVFAGCPFLICFIITSNIFMTSVFFLFCHCTFTVRISHWDSQWFCLPNVY